MMGKCPGIDYIPAELLKYGGDAVIDVHIICNKIWKPGEWSFTWTQSLFITLLKKCNLKKMQKLYRTISHASKVMLKVFLSRSKK